MLESVQDSKTTVGLPYQADSMLKGLFSFYRSVVLWAGMCLLAGLSVFSMLASSNLEASAFQETSIDVTLNSVNGALPNSPITIDLEITCPDTLDTLSIDGFRFALAYNTAVLELSGVIDNGLKENCQWSFYFIQSHLYRMEPPDIVLEVFAEDTSDSSSGGGECFQSNKHTITLEFETKVDTLLYDTFTTVDFYWRHCDDNILWTSDHDTALLALQVFDAGGGDITDDSDTLPSFTGPHSSCFDSLSYGDMVVVHAVRFQSGKIEFEALTDVAENPGNEANLPATARLRQNYPNPFNPSTTIEFYLPVRTSWRLEIINLKGQVVTEFSGVGGPGSLVLPWNGQDNGGRPVSSGVYFYRLITGEHRSTKKMLLLR